MHAELSKAITFAFFAALLGAVFLVAVFVRTAKDRIHRHGAVILVWRYLSGEHWTGEPQVTIEGKPLSKTGHVRPFWLKPRRVRARLRCQRAAALPSILFGFAEARLIGYAVCGLIAVYFKYKAIRTVRRKRAEIVHLRTYVQPVHLALHPHIHGVHLTTPAKSWVQVAPDKSRIELALPTGTTFTDRELERVVNAAGTVIGLANPHPITELEGAWPRLIIESMPAPPDNVTLEMVRPFLESLDIDELLLGLGVKAKPVKVSLSGDSPHLGMSMRSGRGKSVTARFLIAQALAKGWGVVVLDSKRFSQQWCKSHPNVIYARSPAEIHAACVRLGQELDKRNNEAELAADLDGEVGHLFTRILVVIEELNMTQKRLMTYWKEFGTGGPSPAVTAMGDLAFAGRQVMMHLVVIAQRLSAKATGDGDVRENLGAKFINGSKKTWDMLCEDQEMPSMPSQRGRFYLVVSDDPIEVQAPFITGADAREMADSGVALRRHNGTGTMRELARPGVTPGQPYVTVPTVPPGDLISLKDASSDQGTGLVEATLTALRSARRGDRDNGFPRYKRKNGRTELYDKDELCAWDERRHGGKVAA